jgi:5'-AMP-activated protein kinase catalytic alpha subunit
MICGYLPFEDPKTSNLYKKILSADYTIPKFVSADGRDILTKILYTDPEERLNLTHIRTHNWYKLAKVSVLEKGLYPGL